MFLLIPNRFSWTNHRKRRLEFPSQNRATTTMNCPWKPYENYCKCDLSKAPKRPLMLPEHVCNVFCTFSICLQYVVPFVLFLFLGVGGWAVVFVCCPQVATPMERDMHKRKIKIESMGFAECVGALSCCVYISVIIWWIIINKVY